MLEQRTLGLSVSLETIAKRFIEEGNEPPDVKMCESVLQGRTLGLSREDLFQTVQDLAYFARFGLGQVGLPVKDALVIAEHAYNANQTAIRLGTAAGIVSDAADELRTAIISIVLASRNDSDLHEIALNLCQKFENDWL